MGSRRKYRKLRPQPPAPPDNDSRYIPLTQGKFALVDLADYEWLNQWNWFAKPQPFPQTGWYAARNTGKRGARTIRMHQLIMGNVGGIDVDHIDGDGFNNRRKNLRLATRQQNGSNRKLGKNNTSGIKGVVWYAKTGKWRAKIGINRRTIHIGFFSSKELAAKAYDDAAMKHFGAYARPNKPVTEEPLNPAA
jgi:AP2 domain/HNH endonuclease